MSVSRHRGSAQAGGHDGPAAYVVRCARDPGALAECPVDREALASLERLAKAPKTVHLR